MHRHLRAPVSPPPPLHICRLQGPANVCVCVCVCVGSKGEMRAHLITFFCYIVAEPSSCVNIVHDTTRRKNTSQTGRQTRACTHEQKIKRLPSCRCVVCAH